MPKVDHQAILEVAEVKAAIEEARRTGPLAFALMAWCYEFGARAAEPGMQTLRDVDLKFNRARPAHLKSGQNQAWQPLLPFCREALPLWLAERETWTLQPGAKGLLFPSRFETGQCYACVGTGKRPILKREDERRFHEGTAKCHHCNGTGKHWGLKRQETYRILGKILKAIGLPPGRQHPHVLRHSIITHLLDAGTPATVVQDRVGHRNLNTTLNYARVTQKALSEMEGRLRTLYE
jgi:integrase